MTATRPEPGELRAHLVAAGDVPAAAERLMDVLVAEGFELPSLYLERGGRLRCIAQRGYWQVYDGLAPGAGVMGTTFATGRTTVVRQTDEVADYIRAIPDAVAEVCVPLPLAGRAVGVLNVESRSPVDDEAVTWIEDVAVQVAEAMRELGGPPVEEPAELLARLGSELAALTEAADLARHALAAALTVSGMSSAALFPASSAGGPGTVHTGPLGPMLGSLPREDVEQLSGYVARATSSYAVGLAEGDGFEATRALRARGVGSLVVLALAAKGRREGVLVLVDADARPAMDQMIPRLEMLAATTAAMLAAASTSAALLRSERALAHQAHHDPLTGLANRTKLLDAMATQLADAGGRRRLVVLFVDLDGFKVVNDELGHRAGDRLLVAVADRLRHAARGSDLVARIGGDEFVVLCPGVDSVGEATAVGDRILERLAAPFRLGDTDVSVTACIGIAPAHGRTTATDVLEAADDVLAAADRAMYAAKRAGAGTWVLAEAYA
jgi:diguanylate cyclase (GGDEF)-like protein